MPDDKAWCVEWSRSGEEPKRGEPVTYAVAKSHAATGNAEHPDIYHRVVNIRGRGRPPAADPVRPRTIGLNDTDYGILVGNARNAGLSNSAYVRHMCCREEGEGSDDGC